MDNHGHANPGGATFAAHEGTAHATPAQLRLLEAQQEEVQLNAAKIQGLFQYLNFCDSAAFDRCLGRSGKSPECLSRQPDGRPTPRKYATITTTSQNRKLRQQEASRTVMLMVQRKEPAALTDEETMARLKDVFMAYSDPLTYAHTGRREMNIVGFCRLMRDCRLLDNRLTLVAADVIFTRVEAGVDGEADGAASTLLGDLHVDFEEFMRCLRAVVRVKFPAASDPRDAMLLLARKWLLPFARDCGAGGGVAMGNTVDGLFSRSTMNLIRKYDSQLKKLFAWYASMDETDPARVTWVWAREHSGAINSAQFVLMLLNFGVLPVLLSKHAALEVFLRCEAANDGDERADAMFYPAFLETVAEVALEVGKYALSRMRSTSSPDDLKVLRRYAECCPPPHGQHLLQVYEEVLACRGRDASSLDQHGLYDVQAARRRNEQEMEKARRRQEKERAADVVLRREALRQHFALTRLRNFYRDVRTFNNNTTWPPERDLSPTTHRGNGGGGGGAAAGGGGVGVGEGEGVHVAFYDSERAIKTPKPVWIPVCHPAGRRHSHFGPEMLTPMGAAAGGGGGSNVLLIEASAAAGAAASTAAAHAGARHPHNPGGGAAAGAPTAVVRLSGAGPHLSIVVPSSAAANYPVRSPKPYQLKVAIEDRDEHEAIMDLAGRLPYIYLPSEAAVAAAAAAAASARHSVSSVPISLPLPYKPRALTAPAELSRRRLSGAGCCPRGPGGGAGGASTAVSGSGSTQQGPDSQGVSGSNGGGSLAAEKSAGSSCTSARSRLPPVVHQLHRAQATAAALALLAGRPPPPPLYSPDVHITTIHLPPAMGASPLLAAVPASSTAAAGGGGGDVGGASVRPSNSQFSVLSGGAGSGYSPNSSARFSPHSSLTRSRRTTHKRVDAAGLPNLQLPTDTGPSSEVAAALHELDRFDAARTRTTRTRAEAGGAPAGGEGGV